MRTPHESCWQKSTYSGGGDGAECLEARREGAGVIAVRESDDPAGRLAAKPGALAALIRHLKADG